MTYLRFVGVRYWTGIDDLRTITKKHRFTAMTTKFEADQFIPFFLNFFLTRAKLLTPDWPSAKITGI